MQSHRIQFCAIGFLLLLRGSSIGVAGDDIWGFKSGKAKAAKRAFDKSASQAEAQYRRAVEQAQKTYRASLHKSHHDLAKILEMEKVAATKNGNLEEAIKLKKAGEMAAAGEIVSSLPRVPQTPRKRQIPKNAVKFGKSLYYVILGKYSWHRAKRECEKVGGHLVRIENDKEYKFILQTFFPPINSSSNRYLWVDGEKIDGKWVWSNGKPAKLYWASKQPNTPELGEYLVLEKIGKSYGYSDFHASWVWSMKQHTQGFICEWD